MLTKTTMVLYRLACAVSNIKLFRIFEDEWRDKSHIIESMLRHRLGVVTRKIGARKCVVKQLNLKQRKDFFTDNHIDGDVLSKRARGLFYNDELVAALSVRKPFHVKHHNKIKIARSSMVLNT